ncbi:MAG: M1 family aminopeptidase [Phycisphaerales bacterium JB040]
MHTRAIAALTLAAGSGLSLASTAGDPVPLITKHDGCGKRTLFSQLYKAGVGPTGESLFPAGIAAQSALSDTDVTHVDLDIEVDFNTKSISGTCAMDVTSEIDGLTEFTFRLDDALTISSLLVNGLPAAWVTDSPTTRTVTLPGALNTGQSFTVEIAYGGVPQAGGFGSFRWTDNGVDPWWVTNPMVSTLSQPYWAHTWWPCKDGDVNQPGDTSDKFTIDMSITAPSNFTSTANGVLTGVTNVGGGKTRYEYSHGYQIPTYLVAFATSEYNGYTQTWNYSDGVNNYSMPVNLLFTQNNDTGTADDDWFVTLDMLTEFSDRFGVYPFHQEQYGMYEFIFSGGMEHQTNTGQLAAVGYTGLDWLTAHELGHQWFGDHVTCRTWNDTWLNEGGASYTEAIWFESQGGSPALIDYMINDSMPSSSEINATCYAYDPTNSFTGAQYEKGSWAYHMLRGVLGDAAFFQAMRDYLAWYAGSSATTEDFKNAVEASSGVELDPFFDRWVYNGGSPNYRFGFTNTSVNGQDYLRVRVRQTQAEPAFEMPVELRADASTDYTVNNTVKDQHFVVPVASPVGVLELDPDHWILRDVAPVSEAWSGGPPVVTAASGDRDEVVIEFIEPLTLIASHFQVVTNDANQTPQGFAFTYDTGSGTERVTLSFGQPLAPGEYLATVSDSVVSAGAGIALDGEPGALPSGDGVAGGDFTFTFTVEATCPADINADGVVDNGDIGAFVALFLAQDLAADFTGDGIVDNGDIGAFVAQFLAGC